MTQLFFNNVKTELNGAITDVQTVITLDDASDLPTSVGAGDFYLLTLSDGPVETVWEIVRVETGRSGNNITVIRGQEGTSNVAWGDTSDISHRVTKETMENAGGGGGGGGASDEVVTGRQIGMMGVGFNNEGVLGFTRDGGDSWSGDRIDNHLGLAGGDVDGPRFVPGSGKAGSYLCTTGSIFV